MNTHISCALLIFLLAISVESSPSDAAMNWSGAMFSSMVRYQTGGATEGDMHELFSDMARRSLAGKRYISYKALRQNAVPCNERGRSYYNCGAAGKVNPYSRGCSVITRCARLYQ